MNSVERIKYYGEQIPAEKAHVIEDTAPPPEWPTDGRIVVENLVAGYRNGPDVIKGISFTVEPKQKVAIVGRTGSGKSSLLVALFGGDAAGMAEYVATLSPELQARARAYFAQGPDSLPSTLTCGPLRPSCRRSTPPRWPTAG